MAKFREQAVRKRKPRVREKPATLARLRLAAIVESSDDAIIGKDINGIITDWNNAAERLFGYSAGEVIGKPISLLMPPDRVGDFAEIMGKIKHGERVDHYETERQKKDGTRIEVSLTISPIIDTEGRIVGASTISRDITERKLAEQALSKVGGRLIEAHEEERSRIARDLHDDIGQRLALLVSDLDGLEKDLPDSAVEVRNRIHEQLKRAHEIAADVQVISHRLHSSKLRLLGIVAAAKSFCKEFSEQHKVEIDFTQTDFPPAVPEEISLCLFRIMQEALQNAVKHSGVQHFQVELRGASDEIHLTVRDAGVGFDREATKNNQGLGLISMQERVNLLKGTFSIESRPERGTTIHARLPLSTRGESALAAWD